METEAILALYDLEQRINIEYPGVRKERRPQVIRYVSETGSLHFILYSRLSGADVEAVIAEEQAYFGPLGEVEWKVYAHDQPADLRQRLVARGLDILPCQRKVRGPVGRFDGVRAPGTGAVYDRVGGAGAGGSLARLPVPDNRREPNEPADRGAVWVSTADDGLGVQMGERPYNNFCRVIR